MKNITRSLPWKVLCFFLCIVMAFSCVAAVVTTVIMTAAGVYRYPQAHLTSQMQEELFRSQADDLLYAVLSPYTSGLEKTAFDADNTNLRWLILSTDGQVLASNLIQPPSSDDPIWQFQADRELWFSSTGSANCRVYGYLAADLPVQDRYALVSGVCALAYGLRYWMAPIAIGCLLLAILSWICLLCVAGRRPRSDALHPGFAHRVPFDLLVAGTGGVGLFSLMLLGQINGGSDLDEFLLLALLALGAFCAFLGLSMSMAARIKTHTLVKNTLIYRAWRLCIRLLRGLWRLGRAVCRRLLMLIRSLPLIWRTGIVVLAVAFLDLAVMVVTYAESELDLFLLWIVVRTAVLGGAALYAAIFMRILQKGGQALAKGELTHKVDTSMMFWDFKNHGENLNRISQGMRTAVEEQLQSERLKTELITNVSHDIKTPLTSIINYATLISEEACNSENHATYAEVLVRKSEQLRRLLDDLVEASKATTGNLEVQLAPCDAGVLLNQASGEFEQRCQDAGLELIVTQPEEPIRILADSRRIWRVFENLLGNACKYSLPGTRVFVGLAREESCAVFTFRNTSKTVLNVSSRELMERFVRGDSARATEGSGLGLSIAQSLTQLQGGTMEVTVEADLFRVTLRFPLAEP